MPIASFPAPSLGAQLAELQREAGLRRRLYPVFVAKHQITQSAADRQMQCLEAAIATFETLVKAAWQRRIDELREEETGR